MTSDNTLWEKFANYDNFLLAWQRTVNVTSRMVQDELGMKVFAYNLQANLEDLVEQVILEDFPYTPLADHKVYVPKPSTTLRTMSLMAVQDVIIYQALVNVIADQSHSFLVSHEHEHVLGNLYSGPGKRWMLKPWKRLYSRYVQRIERLYRLGYSWIASTDIVAFYDTIDHERLLSLIKRYCGCDDKFEGFLRTCLSTWSAHNANSSTIGRGIPQGSNASDFLSNLYLYDIDRELISNGYHYVRYVDDVRILGLEKSEVQRGLILFDLELKCAGLVAQVTKTSVHQIEDIEQEISRLRFEITDPTGTGDYEIIEIPTPPTNEQAESVANQIKNSSGDNVFVEDNKLEDNHVEYDDENSQEFSNRYVDVDECESKTFQQQLCDIFLASFALLKDPNQTKVAESQLTFCLWRLEANTLTRDKAISLLWQLPWRSEAVTAFLGKFSGDTIVIDALKKFIGEHKVYSWHRANVIWALYKIAGAKNTGFICREWVADSRIDWYARTIAARILSEVPSQHAFLFECLKKEQETSKDTEATSILRQELAFSAFQRIKSFKKQLALLQQICSDNSPILHRLAIYLLQQNTCKVRWEDLSRYHEKLEVLSNLIRNLGLSDNVSRPCFIAKTLIKDYQIELSTKNLQLIYVKHYDKAVEHLRESVISFQRSPSRYVSDFHQFIHVTLIAFYESLLPEEGNIHGSNFNNLIQRKTFKAILPSGLVAWEKLNETRNRIEHPIDRNNQTYNTKVKVKEVDFLRKQLKVALQEMFEVWLDSIESNQDEAYTNIGTENVANGSSNNVEPDDIVGADVTVTD